MNYRLNSTEAYHRGPLETLGWELTVCNSLEDPASPCRGVLKHPSSFGAALYRHLSSHFPMGDLVRVVEIGGGYGNLMADFTRLNPGLRPLMLDLSPALLEKQRQSLAGRDAEFLEGDFFSLEPGFFSPFDLALLNENCGDFPAVCDVPAGVFCVPPAELDPALRDLVGYYATYGFERPGEGYFTFNLGAVRALERLCRAGVPRIYLSEHSCEARAPKELADALDMVPSMNPEPIALKGHVEYTIRFSHLEKVASHHGYSVRRGCFADFLEVDFTPEINFILRSRSTKNDTHEIIRQFIADLYKYEYLILRKGPRGEA